MRISIVFTLLFYLIISCNNSNNVNAYKEYSIEDYKFCIPSNWKSIGNSNYDSKSFLFINKKDSIIISNGDITILDNPIIVNNEDEKNELIKFSNGELSSNDIIFYRNKDFDISHTTYLANYYYYDKINKLDVLLIFPKKQKGTIGAIFNKNSMGEKLSIYCNNPSTETQKELKGIFQTVTLK